MSALVFTGETTSLKFSTAGLTGGGGVACMGGGSTFSMYVGASYYANGNYNCKLSATRGLINNVMFQNGNVSAAAGCSVANNATSIGLGTYGITGDFTCTLMHPESIGNYRYYFGAVAQKYTEIQVKIKNGIIYGWYDWACYQNIYYNWSIGYYYGNLTRTAGVAAETTQGVFIADVTPTSVGFASGLSGTMTYYYVDNLNLYTNGTGAWWAQPHYGTISITLLGGILQAITYTPIGNLYYLMST